MQRTIEARVFPRFCAAIAVLIVTAGALPASAAEKYEIRPRLRAGYAWKFDQTMTNSVTLTTKVDGESHDKESHTSQKRAGQTIVTAVHNGVPTSVRLSFDHGCIDSAKEGDREQNFRNTLADRILRVREDENGKCSVDAGKSDEKLDYDSVADAELQLALDQTVYPTTPVTVGQEWEPDSTPVRAMLKMTAGDQLTIRCKLTAVGSVAGRKTYDIQTTGTVVQVRNEDRDAVRFTIGGFTRVDAITGLPLQTELLMKGAVRFDLPGDAGSVTGEARRHLSRTATILNDGQEH